MPFLPIAINLEGRKVLMVGGGKVAGHKLKALSLYGVEVTVVAPQILPEVEVQAGCVIKEPYYCGHLEGHALVYACTDKPEVNRQVSRDGGSRGLLVCVADAPSECTFISPALFRRGDMSVAISSGGRDVCRSLAWRKAVMDFVDNKVLPEEGSVPIEEKKKSGGRVYLVGAGPGDPGLLTRRALELFRSADIVLHDALVSREVLALIPPKTEIVCVGKEAGRHQPGQAEINRQLVAQAREGKCVVRLKGGDPFIFGRGGEEAQVCVEAGIPFEVVPGISSVLAAAAYAGIPLTHRDHSASVALITGHRRVDAGEQEIPVPQADTLVYYMGVRNLPCVMRALLESGWSASTPVAVIHKGTTQMQEVVCGSIDTIAEETRKAGIGHPALIVVGHVVSLREKLAWFEKREKGSRPGPVCEG
ncbi:MAG: uroporphyrinogen-III C-methyltransferase [Planctomycetes bacterium]|nr:uroporphyrinogen-III C-methyltransferase [Planctomycetota bacterium]